MKVEIKTNKNGDCDYFIINGQKFGENISEVTIVIQAGVKPSILLSGKLDELKFTGEDVYVYSNKKEKLLKRLFKFAKSKLK